MVQNNCGVGKRPGEISDLRDLVVIAPGFKGQLARWQMGETSSKILAQEEPLGGISAMVGNLVTGVPGCSQTDTTEPSPTRYQVCVQHRGRRITQPQVHCAYDPGGNPHRAVE